MSKISFSFDAAWQKPGGGGWGENRDYTLQAVAEHIAEEGSLNDLTELLRKQGATPGQIQQAVGYFKARRQELMRDQ